MKDKIAIEEKSKKLVEMTAGFCDKYLDEEFSTTRNKERNPLSKFAMVNGFIVPIDAFVDEIDEQTEEGRKNM